MERRTVDLHMHSSYSSDGTYTIKELFKQARENQMEAIVVADHDTCEGSEEALCEAERTGIYTMPALELSCVDENRMVHILAYGIETGRKTRLLELTEAIQQSRIDILPKIRSNLEREGFYVDMDRVEELAAPHPPVITNFANAILEDKRNEGCPALEPYRPGGAKADRPYIRFIKDYLVAGRKCYVPEYLVDIETGIRAIRSACGVPVLAHPGEWFMHSDERKVEWMTACGLQGIEVYTPYHTKEKEAYFKALADRYGLFQTAGSDYHDVRKKPGHLMGGIPAADIRMFRELENLAAQNRRDIEGGRREV